MTNLEKLFLEFKKSAAALALHHPPATRRVLIVNRRALIEELFPESDE